jgi:hypothetical protein
MARAEFSERHYELAINLELVQASHQYFVPSQNEEAALGYDIALVPALPPIWSSLTERLPGVGRTAEPRLPRATSLFLQFKRPDYISNRNGKEAAAREAELPGPTVPYYRFELQRAQLEVLLDLQATVCGRAAVCYAAGTFHENRDFYAHKMGLDVAGNSVFLRLDEVRAELLAGGFDPAQLSEDHRWTYDRHGGHGLLCSEPRRIWGATLEDLREGLREPAAEAEPLEEHVETLTRGINDWRGRSEEQVRRGRLPVREGEELPVFGYATPQIEEPSDAVKAQQLLDALGIGWFLAIPAHRRDQQPESA